MAQYDELIGRLKRTLNGPFPPGAVGITLYVNPDGQDAIAALTDLQAQLAQERATSLAMAALLEEMRREMNGLGERGDHVS